MTIGTLISLSHLKLSVFKSNVYKVEFKKQQNIHTNNLLAIMRNIDFCSC